MLCAFQKIRIVPQHADGLIANAAKQSPDNLCFVAMIYGEATPLLFFGLFADETPAALISQHVLVLR